LVGPEPREGGSCAPFIYIEWKRKVPQFRREEDMILTKGCRSKKEGLIKEGLEGLIEVERSLLENLAR